MAFFADEVIHAGEKTIQICNMLVWTPVYDVKLVVHVSKACLNLFECHKRACMCCRPLVRLNISPQNIVFILSSVFPAEIRNLSQERLWVRAQSLRLSAAWLYSTDAGIKSRRERSRAACVNSIDLTVTDAQTLWNILISPLQKLVCPAGRADQ